MCPQCVWCGLGCDKSSGSYWCALKGRCVTTWESCEELFGYNELCTAKWSGLSWDLSALKGKTFTITDSMESGPSYAYAFSVCGNANLQDSSLTQDVISKCSSTVGAAGEVMSDPAPAYQVHPPTSAPLVGMRGTLPAPVAVLAPC